MSFLIPRARCFTLVLGLCACGEAEAGAVRVTVAGQSEAVSGAFIDGFHVTFDHVVVCVEAFALESADGETLELDVDPVIVDLRDGSSDLWQTAAPIGTWSGAAFRTRAARHSDRVIGDVGDNEIHYMLVNQYGMYVSGSATKGSETFTFALGFPAMRYTRCENGVGIEVAPDAVASSEIGFHLDHMFFDSLADEEGHLRFEPFAAAALSNEVTNPFLSQPLANLADRFGVPILEGEAPVEYDPGPFELSPATLEQYFLAAGRTLGRLNGSGHCDERSESP
jgi:hypothetical protein